MTIASDQLIATLEQAGIASLAGVPCSSMTGLINLAIKSEMPRYVNAPNEGEAAAYAAGCWLGGARGGVLIQNSGLGNLYNALTSLLDAYRIPTWLMIGWRGMPEIPDEPQHERMGAISQDILKLAGAEIGVLDGSNLSELRSTIDTCFDQRITGGRLVPLKSIDRGPASEGDQETLTGSTLRRSISCVRHAPSSARTRAEAVEALAQSGLNADVFATTGFIGRELYTRADRPNHFYMAGSMGHIAPLALGHADTTGRPVLALDGDGALLMRLSGLAFVGSRAPSRFAHLTLDNAAHESTGAQDTLSATTDLAYVASACGYKHCLETDDIDAALQLCRQGLEGDGPVFVRLRIRTGGSTPERIRIPLPDLAARFREATSGVSA